MRSADHVVLDLRDRKNAQWVIDRGFELGQRYVDVHINAKERSVSRILDALDARAQRCGAKLIRNRAGLDQRRVVVRFPRRPSFGDGWPPAGDRVPRDPRPTLPSLRVELDPTEIQ